MKCWTCLLILGTLCELSQALENMQIFATTHSHVTALGTRQSENIIALHRKDDEIKMADLPSLGGYAVGDALVEEDLFGTDPYPLHTRVKLERHHELATIPAQKRTPQQVEEMKKLETELEPASHPGVRDDPVTKKLEELTELLNKKGHETEGQILKGTAFTTRSQ
ncbi:MAG: hypothetical protein GY757_01560 [bacterium]|nr:hypothetical protein [bacterium]